MKGRHGQYVVEEQRTTIGCIRRCRIGHLQMCQAHFVSSSVASLDLPISSFSSFSLLNLAILNIPTNLRDKIESENMK